MPAMPRAVLFDLDGTLVDTAPDLGGALNRMLQQRGRPALAAHAIRAQASHGSQGLIRLAFGVADGDPGLQELRREFLDHYAAHLADRSELFPGMATLLGAMVGTTATAWIVAFFGFSVKIDHFAAEVKPLDQQAFESFGFYLFFIHDFAQIYQ